MKHCFCLKSIELTDKLFAPAGHSFIAGHRHRRLSPSDNSVSVLEKIWGILNLGSDRWPTTEHTHLEASDTGQAVGQLEQHADWSNDFHYSIASYRYHLAA